MVCLRFFTSSVTPFTIFIAWSVEHFLLALLGLFSRGTLNVFHMVCWVCFHVVRWTYFTWSAEQFSRGICWCACSVFQYDQYKTPMENIGLQDSLLSRFDLLFIVLDKVWTFWCAFSVSFFIFYFTQNVIFAIHSRKLNGCYLVWHSGLQFVLKWTVAENLMRDFSSVSYRFL